ncbi:MAG: FAD-dependent oxidoreductase [Solirubrobacteraceae bacterium]
MTDGALSSSPGRSPRVLIAGGGIAALESALALRKLAGDRVELELVSSAGHFIYRPHQILEPFRLALAERVPWADIAAELRLSRVAHDLSVIDPDQSAVRTTAGLWHPYDALIIALGAIAHQAVPGSVTIGAPGASYALRRLLSRVRLGVTHDLVFVAPPECSWTIALYELALLSAAAASEAGVRPEFTLVTAEPEPLAVFGPEATCMMRELLDRSGVELHTGSRAIRFEHRRLITDSGEEIVAEAAIALPQLGGPSVSGVMSTPQGFLVTDRDGRVHGEAAIYAAGDVTDGAIKQGGLAAQQADAIAHAIARRAGADVPAWDDAPVLRAALLTGGRPRYLRRELGTDTEATIITEIAEDAPWWPATKVVGRYLAPYLATRAASSESRYFDR